MERHLECLVKLLPLAHGLKVCTYACQAVCILGQLVRGSVEAGVPAPPLRSRRPVAGLFLGWGTAKLAQVISPGAAARVEAGCWEQLSQLSQQLLTAGSFFMGGSWAVPPEDVVVGLDSWAYLAHIRSWPTPDAGGWAAAAHACQQRCHYVLRSACFLLRGWALLLLRVAAVCLRLGLRCRASGLELVCAWR